MTNDSSEDRVTANFLATSFRLLVDGVLRAPENSFHEVVQGHSEEGAVESAFYPSEARNGNSVLGLNVGTA
jgi:hypothetical protein